MFLLELAAFMVIVILLVAFWPLWLLLGGLIVGLSLVVLGSLIGGIVAAGVVGFIVFDTFPDAHVINILLIVGAFVVGFVGTLGYTIYRAINP